MFGSFSTIVLSILPSLEINYHGDFDVNFSTFNKFLDGRTGLISSTALEKVIFAVPSIYLVGLIWRERVSYHHSPPTDKQVTKLLRKSRKGRDETTRRFTVMKSSSISLATQLQRLNASKKRNRSKGERLVKFDQLKKYWYCFLSTVGLNRICKGK
jgi:hypothetical protein